MHALVTAYPRFGASGDAPGVRKCWGVSPSVLNLEDQTFRFLERVVQTLDELFPFRYVHFGGDEARTDEWAASAQVQRRQGELGIATDGGVQDHFTRFLEEHLASRGRQMIGWDEIIDDGRSPADQTGVMYWRDTEDRLDLKALRRGHPVVLANGRHTYFDKYQDVGTDRDHEPLAIGGQVPLELVYGWEPLAEIDPHLRDGVLGAQAQAWTEYIATRNHLDYMVYPRACALAQVLWTGPQREGWDAFLIRCRRHSPRLDRAGVTYCPLALRC